MKAMDKQGVGNLGEIFLVALRLGLTSFGGPMAHLGYFHAEYVQKRRWLDERSYSELVALCQFLPGPASSQLGIGIGTLRGGVWGGLLAWLGFTLPSALLLAGFAAFVGTMDLSASAWVHGLKIVALVVVFQAVLAMWAKLVQGPQLATIAVATMALTVVWDGGLAQFAAIGVAGVLGLAFLQPRVPEPTSSINVPYGRVFGGTCLGLFLGLLVLFPLLSGLGGDSILRMLDGFYRSGALVFGGGHVVLPLLENEFVAQGMVEKDTFLAGYGAAQAVPGPLFTFAAFLGMAMGGIPGAILGVLAIFLPAYLLIAGSLPFWDSMRRNSRASGALAGVNAAVVGILLAALYNPLGLAIQRPIDLFLAAVLALPLLIWKWPPLASVVLGVAASLGLRFLGLF